METKQPIKLFYSYSHEDDELRKELVKHLKSLQRQNYIEPWNDRDISAGDEWKSQIDGHLEVAEIILLLVSSSFISSDYCYELEMRKALEMHDEGKAIVIPIILRDCNWQITPFGKLNAIPTDGKAITGKEWHNQDEAFTVTAKMLQAKIEEIWKKKEASIANSGTDESTPKLQIRAKDIPTVKPYFAGRTDKLNELKDAFANHHFILIEGSGGIGKTQLVAKFITDESLKDKTVWFVCSPTSQPDDVIRGAGFEEILKGKEKTNREKYSAFKDKIEEHDLVVFLDNFHDVENNENFQELLSFVDEYLSKGQLVILGRDNIAAITDLSPKRIHVQGLEAAASLEHAKGLIDLKFEECKNIPDSDLQSICDTLQGYPLAIDLAINLLSKNVAPSEIITVAVKEAKEGNTTIEGMVERLLNAIFTREDATAEEIEFLKLFSVFYGKVDINAVKAVIPEAIFNKANQNLKNRNLLNIQGNFLEVHPLIREYCYELLEQKQNVHVKAAEYYKELRNKKFNPELEEKIYSHLVAAAQWTEIGEMIEKNGRNFIVLGYLDQLKQMISTVFQKGYDSDIFNILNGDIAQIKGYWQDAIKYFEQAENSKNEEIQLEAKIKRGEMLHRIGMNKDANIIFENISKYTKGNSALLKLYGRALNNLGLMLAFVDNDKDALRLLESALSIRKTVGNKDDIATTIYNISRSCYNLKKYEKAIQYSNDSLTIFEAIESSGGISLCLHMIGTIKLDLKEYEEAMEYFERCLESDKIHGRKHDMSATLNNIAHLKNVLGFSQSAIADYEKSISIKKEVGDKEGISISLSNLAGIYIDGNIHLIKASNYLIESASLAKEIGKTSISGQISWLRILKEKVGIPAYKKMILEAIETLDEKNKKHIDIQEVLLEPRIANKTPGRNDPCPCGSGKKYKACHGKP